MEWLIDHASLWLLQWQILLRDEVLNREWWQWVLFFLPLLILDIPRFSIPATLLWIRHLFGIAKNDLQAKRDFIARKPSVSVLIVGFNEEEIMDKVIESLLELDYPNLEIIVVDDNSSDQMYERCRPYADRGLIKLWKNTGATGRAGRASVSNMALHLSSGEFLLSVDADTSFDRELILHMIGPFHDPKVGVVAGNLKVRNHQVNIWTQMQGIEYMISIGLWKSWLNVIGSNMHASGALGAFRRSTLEQFGGWDPELAEDTDLCLKAKKCGWQVEFASCGLAMTMAPTRLNALIRQRIRWDRGTFRTFFRKHLDLMDWRRFDWRNAVELAQEFIFSILATYLYAIYILVMVIYEPWILVLVLLVSYAINMVLASWSIFVAVSISERRDEEWPLISNAVLLPFYKEIFRWVRLFATTMEIFRVNYEDPFLPQTAWRNTRRW